MLKKILFTLLSLTLSANASVIPQGSFTVKQPNGVSFEVNWKGYTYYQWLETNDGYTVKQNSKDLYWHYAKRDKDGRLVPGKWKVGVNNPDSKNIELHLTADENVIESAKSKEEEWNESLVPQQISGPVSLGVILIEFADLFYKLT